jgi:hypothetical protein
MISKASLGVVYVTAIEAVAFLAGVGIWFVLHDKGHAVAGAAAGTIVWTAITFVEHFVAQNLGWMNPLLQGFPFNLQPPSKR